MDENDFSDFDLEQVIVDPEQQEQDFDLMYFISWQHSLVWFFRVLI